MKGYFWKLSSSYCQNVADKLNHAVTLIKPFTPRFAEAAWDSKITAVSASVLTNAVKISAATYLGRRYYGRNLDSTDK